MLSAFATDVRERTGVAAYTIGDERSVIDRGRNPRGDHMATRARLRGWHVRVGIFSGRERRVVTRLARRGGLRVIERQHVDPFLRMLVVAGLTFVGCTQAELMLTRLSTGLHAVVATDTVVHDGGVINCRSKPRDRAMAHIALLDGGDVIHSLAARKRAVMAT